MLSISNITGLIQIEVAASHYLALAARYFNREFAHPKITLDQRGKCAGTARLRDWHIRLNPVLLQDNPHEFEQEVIPHEIAHLVVHAIWGRVKPHGVEWQKVMWEVFNIPPRTTHKMDVTKVQGAVYAYQCDCQQHQLSVRRHRAVLRGDRQYCCRRCGSTLQPLADTIHSSPRR
ncbi:SprT family zinc-dependent metalloprotease [Tolumonas lignilytica]|uniref:SprT family zinc-dependent metalloprotease n=1 Tax=Tolumonas lignilytica TaxID=1283284 RepID=UPI0004B7D587|nr:SprT family zinc-dependent metalloprotease [Tolumonas lignilytica]